MHNEIVRRRPDLARLLAGPWFMDRKGEVPNGKLGYFELPVFNYHNVRPHASPTAYGLLPQQSACLLCPM